MNSQPSHPAAIPLDELLKQCEVRRQRRSGPGGQHRNKVETGIVITHLPSGVRSEATERRQQEENRRIAATRLRVKLALQLRSSYPQHEPSPLWRSRCVSGRIRINPQHEDFPALLAEALDVLAAHDMAVKEAAEKLGCSTSQLVKFLTLAPQALEQVNARRSELGLSRLRT